MASLGTVAIKVRTDKQKNNYIQFVAQTAHSLLHFHTQVNPADNDKYNLLFCRCILFVIVS